MDCSSPSLLLEGHAGAGDSGGPATLTRGNIEYIAGVNSGSMENNEVSSITCATPYPCASFCFAFCISINMPCPFSATAAQLINTASCLPTLSSLKKQWRASRSPPSHSRQVDLCLQEPQPSLWGAVPPNKDQEGQGAAFSFLKRVCILVARQGARWNQLV